VVGWASALLVPFDARLEYSTDGGATWTFEANVLWANIPHTVAHATSLYRIFARNSTGAVISAASNTVDVT
jgi:hypothetical protein